MESKSESLSLGSPPVQATTSPGINCLRDILIVVAVTLAARIIFMMLMPPFVLSADAQSWKIITDMLAAGQNPYHDKNMCWPPFWLQILFVISKISSTLSISFFRVLQTTLVLADLIVAGLLVILIREVSPLPSSHSHYLGNRPQPRVHSVELSAM